MYPPLLELWTIALNAAESAITAALRIRAFTPQDAEAERRLVAEELRWLAAFARQ